jgi:iron complex outermembrane recepter protein
MCEVFNSLRARRVGRHTVSLLAALWSFAAGAEEALDRSGRNLADLSIEELMNESVTSVSRRAEPLSGAAAAIAVLTRDELLRSGVTSIVDALRLLPGVNVGAQTSSQSAVSARAFNHLYSNKLLVLMDGRAVYSPLFAGVFWDLQRPMLNDVERIEVIRGPGATLWGANAVNGVINVITRDAEDTPGGLWYAGAGNVQRLSAGARYGGGLSAETDYRVWASMQATDEFRSQNGARAGDGWKGWNTGVRVDSDAVNKGHLTWHAEASGVDLDDGASDGYNVNTLARWSRASSERSGVEVQAYYDRTSRNEITRAISAVDTFDASLQHSFALGARNSAIWGVGYRFIASRTEQATPLVTVRDNRFTSGLFSAFLQDELALLPDRLFVTAGTKVEHNDITGFEVQPSLRVRFSLSPGQTVWGSVARAVRTPAAVDSRNVFAIPVAAPIAGPDGGAYVPTLVGNDPRLASEVLHAHEMGYRLQVSSQASIDLAAFYNEYHDLIDFGPIGAFVPGVSAGIAELPLMNLAEATTHGGELSVTLAPTSEWRLRMAYSLLRGRVRAPPDADPAAFHIGAPRHQANLGSFHDFGRLSLTGQLRYVDALSGVRSYLTADLHLTYRARGGFEIALTGRNLLDPRHGEQGSALLEPTAQVPRGVHATLTRRF